MEGNEVASSLLAGGDIHKLPQKERIDAYERVLKEKLYTRSADIVKKGASVLHPTPTPLLHRW